MHTYTPELDLEIERGLTKALNEHRSAVAMSVSLPNVRGLALGVDGEGRTTTGGQKILAYWQHSSQTHGATVEDLSPFTTTVLSGRSVNTLLLICSTFDFSQK
jgi:hypothetical protein